MKKVSQQDHEKITELTNQFYHYAQKIIETHYLQPLKQTNQGQELPLKLKTLLQDGVIERELHGGMHVGRAQFYAIILHHEIKKLFPEYIQTVFKILDQDLGLNENQILILVRYAIIFHDSARLNESRDLWDLESGKNCHEFMQKHNISETLSILLLSLIGLKDKPEQFEGLLHKLDYNNESIVALQYLRKLIYLSDCLDLMRCTGQFKFKYMTKAFEDIRGYKAENHDEYLLLIVKNVYQLIRQQKDMLYNCRIIFQKDKELDFISTSACYNLKYKVKIEHASNVCSVIGNLIKNNTFFASSMKNEVFLSTELATVKPAFNPLIHGTNSFIFSTLSKSNRIIQSPIFMLEQYLVAPMGGEVFQGGLKVISEYSNTCFGRMNAKGENEFSLERIMEKYTCYKKPTFENVTNDLKIYISNMDKHAFTNINILLIVMARAKQLGFEGMNEQEYKNLVLKMEATIQFYYLLLLIGKHIHPNFQLIRQCVEDKYLYVKDDIHGAIRTHLTYNSLIERIIQAKINLSHIYENPTQEQLILVLSLFELPKTSTIESGFTCTPKIATLPETQFFTLNPNYPERCFDNGSNHDHSTDSLFYSISSNIQNMGVTKLLTDFAGNLISKKRLKDLASLFLYQIKELKKRLELLKSIIALPIETAQLSHQQLNFLNNQFPLILICKDETKISLSNFQTQEYRANDAMTIGREIRMIATKTEAQRLRIMKYFEDEKITNVQVVLFSQLIESQKNGKKPKSPYTHKDGFPLLSWLSAKKVPVNDSSPHEMVINAHQYNLIKNY